MSENVPSKRLVVFGMPNLGYCSNTNRLSKFHFRLKYALLSLGWV